MVELAVVVALLLALSFLCSILESVVLSITRPYIQTLVERGSKAGRLLQGFKERIDEPISAILTLNTISHTVGAAVSGALALELFGSKWMAVFSAVLTLLILVFSEILPKTVGARHWRALAPPLALVLRLLVLVLKPIVVPIHFFSRLFSKGDPADVVSREEIAHFIRMGYFQGALESPEFRIMENIFRLRAIPVRDVMTPRDVVFTLPAGATVAEVLEGSPPRFSRIPLMDGDRVAGVVLRRDIMDRMAAGAPETPLAALATPAQAVREDTSVYALLEGLVSAKAHQTLVVDEAGDFTGIATLEDALETLLGREIVDEFDPVPDMRALSSDPRP